MWLWLLFAKGRVWFSRRLGLVILGRVAGRIPFNVLRSLEQYLYSKEISLHIEKMTKLNDSTIVQYEFPKNFPLSFRRSKTFEQRYVYTLKDVVVSPKSGLSWFPEGLIIEESVGSLLRITGWGGILHEPLLPVAKLQIDDPVVVCPPTGYFHWLFEILPNVSRVLASIPEVKILIPSTSPAYVLDALRLILGADRFTRNVLSASKPVRVQNLIMPSVEVYSGFVHPDDVQHIRLNVKTRVSVASEGSPLVYVSRKKVEKRRVGNEGELEERLRSMGFEILTCEDISFVKQIASFSQARIIVGLHGAGLSNLVWSQNECSVVEIFPHGFFNDCYARLALTLGFEYRYVECTPSDESNGTIPINEVSKKLEEMGVDKFEEPL